MQQKSLVLARYPYTNMIDYKIRPALIVSNNAFTKKHASFLVCPITSKIHFPDYELELTSNDFSGTLNTKSFLRCDGITALETSLVLKEIGKVSDAFFEKVKKAVIKNF